MAKWGVESSIPSQYLLVLVALALERGCAPEQLFNNTGMSLDTLGSPGLRIDEVHADQIIANALEATDDPSLGLTVGQQLNLGAHAVVGQTFLACANLLEVMDTLVRYGLASLSDAIGALLRVTNDPRRAGPADDERYGSPYFESYAYFFGMLF